MVTGSMCVSICKFVPVWVRAGRVRERGDQVSGSRKGKNRLPYKFTNTDAQGALPSPPRRPASPVISRYMSRCISASQRGRVRALARAHASPLDRERWEARYSEALNVVKDPLFYC